MVGEFNYGHGVLLWRSEENVCALTASSNWEENDRRLRGKKQIPKYFWSFLDATICTWGSEYGKSYAGAAWSESTG